MNLFRRKSRDDAASLSPEKMMALLSQHPIITEQLQEQHAVDVAARQVRVDAISAARARCEAALPGLRAEAQRLREIAAERHRVYVAAEREHSVAVRAVMDLSYETDRIIGQHEAELIRHADREIDEFCAECQQAHDDMRFLPRTQNREVIGDGNPLATLRAQIRAQSEPDPYQQTAEAMALVRALKTEAAGLKLTADPDIRGTLDKMRDRLEAIVSMKDGAR